MSITCLYTFGRKPLTLHAISNRVFKRPILNKTSYELWKNRTLVKIARTMLHEYSLPLYFWAEAVNTSCYISNRVFKRPILNKTSYELWNNRKPKISYLRVFGCKCFILNTKKNMILKPMKEFS